MTTAILHDPRFLDHDTGRGHPERPARLTRAVEVLESQSWYPSLHRIAPRACARDWLETIHESDYIDRALDACQLGRGYLDTPDVVIGRGSFDIACLAVGGALAICDAVMRGEVDNGFALVRPPGHHAERDTALGFCLFNTVAITARYLQRYHGLDKILILDWDVHHGNGTQHSFEQDGSVFYISLHQHPWYPGTGSYAETGSGAGKGTTLNCPMSAGVGDAQYRAAFEELVLPAARAFKPDAVLISAGFDAHAADPLGGINLSTGFYRWMTDQMIEVADASANGRIISLLEGGYDLEALAACVSTHVEALSGHRGEL
jgi:acetoin utilization deacetylase AcuC-like enzyme